MNKWQVNIKIWQVNIKIWQVNIKIWQVNIIIWHVMAEICHHNVLYDADRGKLDESKYMYMLF